MSALDQAIDHAAQGDWAGAIVQIVAGADSAMLARWENASDAKVFLDTAREFESRLQDARRLSRDEVERHPLALLRALDALQNRLGRRRFTGQTIAAGASRFWLVPVATPQRRVARMRRQVQRWDHHLRHHVVVPEQIVTPAGTMTVRVVVPSGRLADALDNRATRRNSDLGIWVAHFDDGCQVLWQATGAAGRLQATGLDHPEARWAAAVRTFESARRSNSQVLVLPELSLPPDQQRHLVDHALRAPSTRRPNLMLLGSFHEPRAEGLFNCARLLDGFTGLPLIEHLKLRPFGTYGEAGQTDAAEAILPGHSVTLLVTALGNWTVLICKDFVDHDAAVFGLTQVLAADWLLVPSYGDEGNQHAQKRRAREVARVETGTHVVVATQRNLGLSQGPVLPGFCHRAGSDQPDEVGPHGGLVRVTLPNDN